MQMCLSIQGNARIAGITIRIENLRLTSFLLYLLIWLYKTNSAVKLLEIASTFICNLSMARLIQCLKRSCRSKNRKPNPKFIPTLSAYMAKGSCRSTNRELNAKFIPT